MAALVWCLRQLVRVRVENDPRPALRAAGTPYVYALLHAHQIAALLANDEPRGRMAAMVSRSADGDVIVPSLRACGVRVVRGSSGAMRKGGTRALGELRALAKQGIPALLTVDGPRGPRGEVKPGMAALALGIPGAVVLPCVCLPSRRTVVRGSWDRLQVPWPFTRITAVFGEPVRPGFEEDHAALGLRVEAALDELELDRDPEEARAARSRAPRSA